MNGAISSNETQLNISAIWIFMHNWFGTLALNCHRRINAIKEIGRIKYTNREWVNGYVFKPQINATNYSNKETRKKNNNNNKKGHKQILSQFQRSQSRMITPPSVDNILAESRLTHNSYYAFTWIVSIFACFALQILYANGILSLYTQTHTFLHIIMLIVVRWRSLTISL